jgi:hypothetical protein
VRGEDGFDFQAARFCLGAQVGEVGILQRVKLIERADSGT